MDTFRKTIAAGKSRVEVVMENRPFDHRKHRAAYNQGGDLVIDGIRAYGADSAEPRALALKKKHLARFEVRWNGRRVPIPAETHRFVLDFSPVDPERSANGEGTVQIIPAVRGDAILVRISGGDAAGSFTLWWTIRREGVVGFFWEGEA